MENAMTDAISAHLRSANKADAKSVFDLLRDVAPEIPLRLDQGRDQQIRELVGECISSGSLWVTIDSEGRLTGFLLAKPRPLF
jgi:hypothetical protein